MRTSLLSKTSLRYTVQRRLFSSEFVFDQESRLEKVRDGLVLANISNRWSVGDAPNGGFLMSLAVNAIGLHSDHPDPLTISAYYVNKAAENAPAELAVRTVAKGRTTSTFHVTLSQLGVVRSEYLATFGDMAKMSGFTLVNQQAPVLPPIEDCHSGSKVMRKLGDKLRLANEIDFVVPASDPFASSVMVGKIGDKAEMKGYVRFADNRPPCSSSLAFFLDTLPPPSVIVTPTSWVPTLEYTVHFWDTPVPSHPATLEDEEPAAESGTKTNPWLRVTYRSDYIKNSLLYTDGELWSPDGGRLLATSRQFARILEKR